MDVNTIILLIEALLIVGLSLYVWVGVQNAEEATALHWTALAALVLIVIGFGLTLYFNPLAFQ